MSYRHNKDGKLTEDLFEDPPPFKSAITAGLIGGIFSILAAALTPLVVALLPSEPCSLSKSFCFPSPSPDPSAPNDPLPDPGSFFLMKDGKLKSSSIVRSDIRYPLNHFYSLQGDELCIANRDAEAWLAASFLFELRTDSRIKWPAYQELTIKLRDTGGSNAVRVIAASRFSAYSEIVIDDLGPQFQEVVVPISEFERLTRYQPGDELRLWVEIDVYSSANSQESVCIQDIELWGKDID